MIGRNQVLGAQRGQHRQLRIRDSTHTHSLFHPGAEPEHPQPIFSTLLKAATEDRATLTRKQAGARQIARDLEPATVTAPLDALLKAVA
jgi:hypothetical protein